MKQIKQEPNYSVTAKWGVAASGGETGFQPVPDVLLKNQHRLGITNTELAVLLNVTLHWWEAKKLPHPRPSVIARRMGVKSRTVERAIMTLEQKGLMRRLKAERDEAGLLVRRFDLRGLVEKVQDIAEEISAFNEVSTG